MRGKKARALALAGWLSLLEHCSIYEMVAGLIPSQGTYLDCRFDPGQDACRRQPMDVSFSQWCFSLSFSVSPASSFSKVNNRILWQGLKNIHTENACSYFTEQRTQTELNALRFRLQQWIVAFRWQMAEANPFLFSVMVELFECLSTNLLGKLFQRVENICMGFLMKSPRMKFK